MMEGSSGGYKESCGPKVRFVCALNRVPGVVDVVEMAD